MADFAELEEADGVRMTFNVWPNSRIEATKAVVPFACVYTPNKPIANMPVSAGLEPYRILLAFSELPTHQMLGGPGS